MCFTKPIISSFSIRIVYVYIYSVLQNLPCRNSLVILKSNLYYTSFKIIKYTKQLDMDGDVVVMWFAFSCTIVLQQPDRATIPQNMLKFKVIKCLNTLNILYTC